MAKLKKHLLVKDFFDEVFRVNIWIMVGDSQLAKKKFDHWCPENDKEDNFFEYGGKVFTFPLDTEIHQTIYGLYLKDHKSKSTLAHEMVHLVNFIFTNKGISIKFEDDEYYAYFLEYLYRKIEKIITP